MVTIDQKTINGIKYYYLRYSYKFHGKVKTIEKIVGKDLPTNIDEIKNNFFYECLLERFSKILAKLKTNYNKEFKKMPKSARDKSLRQFSIKFTYDSQRIEGSTLTLKETADLLEEGISPNKPLGDVKEAEQHDNVFFDMLDYEGLLNFKTVLGWHYNLFKFTKQDISGKVRKHNVGIARSKAKFPSYIELDFLLNDFFKWYKKNNDKIHPVILAALVHLKFVSIHPFSDGNGRISRLLMNFVLKKNGYPMLNIHYLNRKNYYNSLERCQVKGDDFPFVQFIIKRYLREYKEYC